MVGMVSYKQNLFLGALACLVLSALPLGAFAADAAKGEVIAKRWCAACHLVTPDQTRANSDAPSFAAIAHKITSSKALTAFLMDPHPIMPDMNLTRERDRRHRRLYRDAQKVRRADAGTWRGADHIRTCPQLAQKRALGALGQA